MMLKLRAIWQIIQGKGLVYKMRIWREGDLICMATKGKEKGSIVGGAWFLNNVIHAGVDYKIDHKAGPAFKFPLVDNAK